MRAPGLSVPRALARGLARSTGSSLDGERRSPTPTRMSSGLKAGLEKRASHLKVQLAADELKREEYRSAGRQALDLADNILQSVEQSLDSDSGAMSSRPARNPLPPIRVAANRPDTAEG